jgi:hypothetical protein
MTNDDELKPEGAPERSPKGSGVIASVLRRKGMPACSTGVWGSPSPKRIGPVEIDGMLELYRTAYRGWIVKHFHEHGVRDHSSLGATPGRRRNCRRRDWLSGRSGAGRTGANGRGSHMRA